MGQPLLLLIDLTPANGAYYVCLTIVIITAIILSKDNLTATMRAAGGASCGGEFCSFGCDGAHGYSCRSRVRPSAVASAVMVSRVALSLPASMRLI